MSDISSDHKREDTSHAEKVQQTQAQLEAIENEVRQNQPLTSSRLPVRDTLSAQYKTPAFLDGIDALAKKYQEIRTVRGDGNCYYRAFLYQLCENLLEAPMERDRICKLVKESMKQVTGTGGYEEMTMEIFYESLVDLLERLTTSTALHEELILENATSDYCTWYLRVLTATHLKADPSRFLPYLEDGYVDIAAFCQGQIEPMGKECSMVQVLALAEVFQVSVSIEYLDGHELSSDGKLTCHSFGDEESSTKLTLLYRPGHYDILYAKA